MSFTIVCHGCGARLTVADDYPRNKMQCTECGVVCPVPPRPDTSKKAAERPPAEAAAFEDDETAAPVRAAASPPPATTFVKDPAPVSKGLATCPHCGEMVRVPARKRGRPAKCSACGADWPAPAAPPKPPPLPIPPLPDEFAGSTPDVDSETSNPYRTADAGTRRCPGCSAQLTAQVVFCVRCGFDLRLGRKVVKEYQKLERSWDSGMSLKTRLILFALCQVVAVNAIVSGLLVLEEDSLLIEIATFGVSWVVYTAITAFLLGTFDHSDLKRYKSGRVDLNRRWRVGFIQWPVQKIDLRDYSGVIDGVKAHVGMWDWYIFLVLLSSGIVPGLIFWYCAIYKTEYTVALTKDHAIPEIYVYRGWRQEQAQEITQTLRDALTV